MSSNDCIVLDGILEDRQKQEGGSIGETFEKFAFEQILKEYALTPNQIDDGWVDGEGDGGIDGFYVVVNGYLYGGDPGFQWPRENPHITLWILTCKHRDGFIEAPLTSMHATLSELLDCGKKRQDLVGDYSETLLDARDHFLCAYKALARLDPLIEIRFVYASRGDASVVSDAVKGRMLQLEEVVKKCFGRVDVRSDFVGSRELLQLHRKIKDENLELPFVASLTHDENNYVVIAKLSDYYKFVCDDDGKLRRYLFESNVRDFLGYNNVNGDIDFTLKHPSDANFWWLNNGITILATNAHAQGHCLHLSSVQIVNGLQTTETLYRHFAGGSRESLDKNILIKVLTSQDAGVRTNIIQATNNQSNVMSYSLHATDDIQRNIEDVLCREDFYFERRDRYYKNEGKPDDRSITPLELAKSFLSIVHLNPAEASGLKNKFMRNPISYNAVFNSSLPIDKWSVLAATWLATGRVFRRHFYKVHGDVSHPWKPLVAYCAIARKLGKFNYSIRDIKCLTVGDVSEASIREIWEWITPLIHKFKAGSRNKLKKPYAVYGTVLGEIALKTKLPGIEAANRRKLARVAGLPTREVEMTEELIARVADVLPPQPWRPGVHQDVCRALGVRPSSVYDAIDVLIDRGVFHEQKDGIVYADDGKVLMVDPMRCESTVAELNEQIKLGTFKGLKR